MEYFSRTRNCHSGANVQRVPGEKMHAGESAINASHRCPSGVMVYSKVLATSCKGSRQPNFIVMIQLWNSEFKGCLALSRKYLKIHVCREGSTYQEQEGSCLEIAVMKHGSKWTLKHAQWLTHYEHSPTKSVQLPLRVPTSSLVKLKRQTWKGQVAFST